MIRSILGRIAIAGFAVLGTLATSAVLAQAANWPVKPVRFIVPFPPGGTVDPLARLLGTRLNAALGQQFIVDNRTGGSGAIGTAIAAKANPEELQKFVVTELARWSKVVREFGIKAE
jgi:tripartite-type tricarboxylate transporter receptor subunit TctC